MFAHYDYPYRVFLSYSRDDSEDALRLVEHLHQLHLQPVWDQQNPGGWPFLDEIKKQIAHSHIFIPLLTPRSVRSTWVNHEIGYAMGRNIPVLPLSLGTLPEGMAAGIQAEVAESIQDLLLRLTRARINPLVERAHTVAVYECADLVETRTEAIIEHCEQVEALIRDHEQPLRHRATFGSFSLPSSPHDDLWAERYDDLTGGEFKTERLSKERRVLEEYAKRFGCDLILYPSIPHLSRKAIRARVQVLQSFLKNMREAYAPVRVAFDKRALEENLIIVGDWFCAESTTPRIGQGYRHTTITCHAPTVLKRIEAFEGQFVKCNSMPPDSAILWLDEQFMKESSSPA